MRRFIFLFCLSAFLLTITTVRAVDRLPDTTVASKAAIAWLNKNSKFGPEDRMNKAIAEKVREDVGQFNSVTLIFDGGVMKSGKGALLMIWAGRVHVLALSDAQVRGFGVKPMNVSYRQGSTTRDYRTAIGTIQLSNLKLDGGRKMASSGGVAGSVTCQVKTVPSKKLAIRLSYSVNGRTTSQFHWLDKPLTKGSNTLRFRFKGLSEEETRHTGPLVVVVDLCTVEEKNDRVEMTIHGNSVPMVVDVS